MKLVPPCGYVGGKRSLSKLILPHLMESKPTQVMDLCAGSGAISLALISAGMDPAQVVMVEAGPWGAFYKAAAEGTLDTSYIEKMLISEMPADPKEVRAWVEQDIALRPPTPEHFLVVQAAGFGSVPVWWDGSRWRSGDPEANRGYRARSYWEPGPDSPESKPRGTIFRPDRIVALTHEIVRRCKGLRVQHTDIKVADLTGPEGTVYYMDPPYLGTSGYGFSFDVSAFVDSGPRPLYVSEGREMPGADRALFLKARKGSSLTHGAKGRGGEYLNVFGLPKRSSDLWEQMFEK